MCKVWRSFERARPTRKLSRVLHLVQVSPPLSTLFASGTAGGKLRGHTLRTCPVSITHYHHHHAALRFAVTLLCRLPTPRVCQCTNPRCSSCVSPASHSLSSWWCMTPPVPPIPAETHNRRDRGVSVSGRRIAYPSSDSTVPFPRHAASPDTKLF